MTATTSTSSVRKYLPMFGVAVAVFVIDQISKAWAHGDWGFHGLERCSAMIERPTAGFCLAFNEGMAFSLGWGAGMTISVIVLAVVVALLWFARNVGMWQRLVMGAIIGGAFGNLADRAFRAAAPGTHGRGVMGGAVVDFLYSSFWATFNVADMAVVIGGILLAIAVWNMPESTPDLPSGTGPAADDAATPATSSADADHDAVATTPDRSADS